MGIRTTQLYCKEVICIGDGRRLGCVSDVELLVPQGQVAAIVVPGPCKCFGLMGHKEELVIPWNRICRIGPDIVLVDIDPESCRVPRKQRCLQF